jgi:hypothetical protein
MQGQRALPAALLYSRETALGDAGGGGQLLLRKLAPLANDLDGIFAVGEAIGVRERDQDLAAGGKLAARACDQPGGGVFLGLRGARAEPVIVLVGNCHHGLLNLSRRVFAVTASA